MVFKRFSCFHWDAMGPKVQLREPPVLVDFARTFSGKAIEASELPYLDLQHLALPPQNIKSIKITSP